MEGKKHYEKPEVTETRPTTAREQFGAMGIGEDGPGAAEFRRNERLVKEIQHTKEVEDYAERLLLSTKYTNPNASLAWIKGAIAIDIYRIPRPADVDEETHSKVTNDVAGNIEKALNGESVLLDLSLGLHDAISNILATKRAKGDISDDDTL